MGLTDFKVLTFDCYGTLIDWEQGIDKALQPLLRKLPTPIAMDDALAAFAEAESVQEAKTPTMLYSEILSQVYRRLAERWGVSVNAAECAAFGGSIPDWPPFPDSPSALRYLKRFCKLVILSNVDRESFAATNQRLEVEFDAIYTAEDIGSYKPDHRNFQYMIDHLRADFDIQKSQILHTAQSLFHDYVPAKALGLATCWIDRRSGKSGWGATKPPAAAVKPDFHFATMAELVRAHRLELNRV